jgi:putative flippase GtrA
VTKTQLLKQKVTGEVGRFGLVGILNTLLDIVLVNVLTQLAGMDLVLAGIISGTVAMINSFIFNQRFTFKVKKVSPVQTLYFFAITMFGLYVIRPLILQLFTKQWLTPGEFVYSVTSSLSLPFSRSFDINNFALGMAILVVLVYNFLMYRRFVFTEDKGSRA